MDEALAGEILRSGDDRVVKISALIVCVDYADYLAQGLTRWAAGCDRLLVVSQERDEETLSLCGRAGIETYCTDAFVHDGAVFNKGLALSEAIDMLPWEEWFLNIDADVVPPANWREMLGELDPGFLYGCQRFEESGKAIHDSELASYFHLWHTSDENVQRRPLFDCSWRHAGGYDSEFSFRWGPNGWRWLPIPLTHLGERGVNWWGRGNREDHEVMMRQRQANRGIGECERYDGKTRIDWK